MADYAGEYSPAPQRQSQGGQSMYEDPQQGGAGGNTIADLEHQLQALKIALEGERKRRTTESSQAATRERILTSRLKSAEAASPAKKVGPIVPRVAGLARPRPATPKQGERTVAATTPRTADNLFVATPTDSRTSTPRGRTYTPKRWGTSGSRLGTAGQEITASGLPTAGGVGSPYRERELASMQRNQTTTALQVAWNKFCIKARKEFTPPELALVSKDTLEHLMNHYGIQDAVEKAQIEGQWALLQEGKQSVGPNATPKVIYKKNRGPLRFPEHTHEFSLDGAPPKKSLSARTPLRNESPRAGNPNDTTSASGYVRTTSAHRVITPRRAGPGDPNDTQTYSQEWKSCSGYASGPQQRKSPARGMMHVNGPSAGDFTPRGIRSDNGSTAMGGDSVKPNGLRTGNENHPSPGGSRRGIRTGFTGDHSPVRVHRPSKIVSSPNHVERCHLTTKTMMSAVAAGSIPHRTSHVEAYQRKTPFALDLAPVSANARSQR